MAMEMQSFDQIGIAEDVQRTEAPRNAGNGYAEVKQGGSMQGLGDQ